MSHLLDVNFLLACGWSSHARHTAARAWLEAQSSFTTSPLSELGFIRVSMTPAYRASFADAQSALADITSRPHARIVARMSRSRSCQSWRTIPKSPTPISSNWPARTA
jgi:predicted nucleic acid-binding protein